MRSAGTTSKMIVVLAVLSALLLIPARPAQAQTETVVHSFTYSDGSNLIDGLTSDGAGNFYGSAPYGYPAAGTVFELSPNGSGGWTTAVLYSFTGGADGATPVGRVIFDRAGNLYGATLGGGAYGKGTVFELSRVGTSWTETVLYSFGATKQGNYPETGLVMDAAGNLYGATTGGVYQLSPSGGGWTKKVIYGFGKHEVIASDMTMDAAGNIYGAASSDVIELSPNGKGGWRRIVLYKFAVGQHDGSNAQGTPVFDLAGNLYGTTSYGGAAGSGNGTVYELSPTKKAKWTEKILYSFQGGSDGISPFAGLVFDTDGNIYGAARFGGSSNQGTVFELVSQGGGNYQEKVLWSFDGADGDAPYGTPILDGAGNLYGTTYRGGFFGGPCEGILGCGVVYEVTP